MPEAITMNFLRCCTVAVLLGAAFLGASVTAQGLYGDGKEVTTCDLNNQDYWWTKYDAMMLERPVNERRPKGRWITKPTPTSSIRLLRKRPHGSLWRTLQRTTRGEPSQGSQTFGVWARDNGGGATRQLGPHTLWCFYARTSAWPRFFRRSQG